jgi:dimethylaniline monooxygenase (N-oxide forming)
MTKLPTVCVIGAGSSGIAASKTLHQRGFGFDCFEKSDRVGGNWVFRNANGMSSSYSTLYINARPWSRARRPSPPPRDVVNPSTHRFVGAMTVGGPR